MTGREFKALLPGLRADPIPERTPFCPDDSAISQLFEGKTDGRKREALLNHLATCIHCQARMGAIAQLADLSGCEPSDTLLARAKMQVADRAPQSSGGAGRRALFSYSIAAAMLMATVLFLLAGTREFTGQVPESNDLRELRSLQPGIAQLTVLNPIAGAKISPGELKITWTPVGDTSQYEISLMNEFGDLLLQEKVIDSHYKVNADLGLEPGAKYFFYVSAYLGDGRVIASSHVGFQVEPGSGNGN